MAYMAQTEHYPPMTHWHALRLSAGLSQREVERRLNRDKRGHLSLIERGLFPSAEQEEELRRFYAELLLAPPEPTIDAAAS